MTEEEAKTRWCPFSRVGFYAPSGPSYPAETGYLGNREPNTAEFPPNCNCIASACMSWRKSRHFIDRGTNEPAMIGVMSVGQLEERYSGHGYCGLAGPPS